MKQMLCGTGQQLNVYFLFAIKLQQIYTAFSVQDHLEDVTYVAQKSHAELTDLKHKFVIYMAVI